MTSPFSSCLWAELGSSEMHKSDENQIHKSNHFVLMNEQMWEPLSSDTQYLTYITFRTRYILQFNLFFFLNIFDS